MTSSSQHQPEFRPDNLWSGPAGWRGQAVDQCRSFDFFALPWDFPWKTLRRRNRITPDGLIRCVKCSGGRYVLRVENPRAFGADLDRAVYAKCYSIDTCRQRVGNIFSGGKARREYRLGWALLERGFLTPIPLAWALAGPLKLLTAPNAANFLLTLELENQGTLPFWAENGQADQTPGFYTALAGFIAAMHRAAFYHDDCLAKNFAIAPGADFATKNILSLFQIFDIDHGRIYTKELPFGPRAYNLYQMISSLRKSSICDRATRLTFLREYMAAAGLKPAFYEEPLIRSIDRLAKRKLNMFLFK